MCVIQSRVNVIRNLKVNLLTIMDSSLHNGKNNEY